eukprot:tig00000821_g4480.t1
MHATVIVFLQPPPWLESAARLRRSRNGAGTPASPGGAALFTDEGTARSSSASDDGPPSTAEERMGAVLAKYYHWAELVEPIFERVRRLMAGAACELAAALPAPEAPRPAQGGILGFFGVDSAAGPLLRERFMKMREWADSSARHLASYACACACSEASAGAGRHGGAKGAVECVAGCLWALLCRERDLLLALGELARLHERERALTERERLRIEELRAGMEAQRAAQEEESRKVLELAELLEQENVEWRGALAARDEELGLLAAELLASAKERDLLAQEATYWKAQKEEAERLLDEAPRPRPGAEREQAAGPGAGEEAAELRRQLAEAQRELQRATAELRSGRREREELLRHLGAMLRSHVQGGGASGACSPAPSSSCASPKAPREQQLGAAVQEHGRVVAEARLAVAETNALLQLQEAEPELLEMPPLESVVDFDFAASSASASSDDDAEASPAPAPVSPRFASAALPTARRVEESLKA